MPDLTKLADFFSPQDLEWKPITISKRTSKGLAAAYVTNRAVMNRLDSVVGPAFWRNEYRPGPAGGVVCGLSINVAFDAKNPQWVTKWDGADNSDIEATKGGLSNAMRRAAVQWGVGRYLYDFPQQWVPVDDYKQFKHTPRIPDEFLPGREPRSQRPPSELKLLFRRQARPKGITPETFADWVEETDGDLFLIRDRIDAYKPEALQDA